MKRKRCAFPAAALLLCLVLSPCISHALSVRAGDATADPGATDVAIEIVVDNATGIAGGELTLAYDAAVLTATKATPSSLLTSNGITLIANLATAGQVKLSLAGAVGIPSGSGALATIVFDVKSDAASGTYKLEFAKAVLRNEQGQSLSLQSTTSGALTVTGGGTTQPPAPGTGIGVEVGSASGRPGDTGIEIEIAVDDAEGIAGGEITLTYDASALTATQAKAASLLTSNGITLIPNLATAGQVKLSLAGAIGIPSGSGALVTITFDVQGDAEAGSYELTLTKVTLRSEAATAMAISEVKSGTFTIEGGTPPVEAGPIALDLDTQSGDQEQRQTKKVPGIGEEVTVDVVAISGANGQVAFQVKLKYDPSKLEWVGFQVKDVFGAGFAIPPRPSDGEVTINVAIMGGAASRDAGSMGHATFKVLDDVSTETKVELTYASYESEVEVGSGGAVVLIGGTPPEPPKPDKPSPDFDGNGEVGFSDFISFARVFGAREGDGKYEWKYDLDVNGEIGFSDFIQFARVFGKKVEEIG